MVDLVVSFSYLGHDLSFRNIPDSTYGVIVKETARRWENDVTDSRAPTLLLEFLERSNSLAVEHDCWGRDLWLAHEPSSLVPPLLDRRDLLQWCVCLKFVGNTVQVREVRVLPLGSISMLALETNANILHNS